MKATLTYTDATERTYTIPNDNLSEEDAATIRAAVAAFNAQASVAGSNVYQTFVSEDGYPPSAITNAQIVITTEEVIYNG